MPGIGRVVVAPQGQRKVASTWCPVGFGCTAFLVAARFLAVVLFLTGRFFACVILSLLFVVLLLV
jgi:hypothetical protein